MSAQELSSEAHVKADFRKRLQLALISDDDDSDSDSNTEFQSEKFIPTNTASIQTPSTLQTQKNNKDVTTQINDTSSLLSTKKALLLKHTKNKDSPQILTEKTKQKTEEIDNSSTVNDDVDDWVCCDNCGKWRLVPYFVDTGAFPDSWVCTMNYWAPQYSDCSIREEPGAQENSVSQDIKVENSKSVIKERKNKSLKNYEKERSRHDPNPEVHIHQKQNISLSNKYNSKTLVKKHKSSSVSSGDHAKMKSLKLKNKRKLDDVASVNSDSPHTIKKKNILRRKSEQEQRELYLKSSKSHAKKMKSLALDADMKMMKRLEMEKRKKKKMMSLNEHLERKGELIESNKPPMHIKREPVGSIVTGNDNQSKILDDNLIKIKDEVKIESIPTKPTQEIKSTFVQEYIEETEAGEISTGVSTEIKTEPPQEIQVPHTEFVIPKRKVSNTISSSSTVIASAPAPAIPATPEQPVPAASEEASPLPTSECLVPQSEPVPYRRRKAVVPAKVIPWTPRELDFMSIIKANNSILTVNRKVMGKPKSHPYHVVIAASPDQPTDHSTPKFYEYPEPASQMNCPTRKTLRTHTDQFTPAFYGIQINSESTQLILPPSSTESDQPEELSKAMVIRPQTEHFYSSLVLNHSLKNRQDFQTRMYGSIFRPQFLRARTTLIMQNAKYERKSSGIIFNSAIERESFAETLSQRFNVRESTPRVDIPKREWPKLLEGKLAPVYIHYQNREDAILAAETFKDDIGRPLVVKNDPRRYDPCCISTSASFAEQHNSPDTKPYFSPNQDQRSANSDLVSSTPTDIPGYSPQLMQDRHRNLKRSHSPSNPQKRSHPRHRFQGGDRSRSRSRSRSRGDFNHDRRRPPVKYPENTGNYGYLSRYDSQLPQNVRYNTLEQQQNLAYDHMNWQGERNRDRMAWQGERNRDPPPNERQWQKIDERNMHSDYIRGGNRNNDPYHRGSYYPRKPRHTQEEDRRY